MTLEEAIAIMEDPEKHEMICSHGELLCWFKELQELRSAPTLEWISCDDKLPATRKTVLIYDEYEGVSAGYYDSDYAKFRSIDDVYRSCNVTHWQPLPEPPKED
jgi:hypothetical protein